MASNAPVRGWRPVISAGGRAVAPGGRPLIAGAFALVLLALLLARLPLALAAATTVACAFLLAALLEPALALAGVALAIPFGKVVPLPLPAGMNVVDLMVVLAVVAWAARGLARRDVRFNLPSLAVPVLVLGWMLALSLTQAQSWSLGLPEWLKWGEFALLYLLATQLLDGRRTAWVLAALFVAGLIEVGLGAYQFVEQVGPKEFVLMGRFMRAYGTFDQPNPYAGYLGYLAPVAASLALAGLGRWLGAVWRRRPRTGVAASATTYSRPAGNQGWPQSDNDTLEAPALRGTPLQLRPEMSLAAGLMCAAVALVLVAGIVMSWSRGAWLGLATALGVVATLRARRWAPLFAVVVALGLAGLLLFGTSWLPAPIAQRLADIDPGVANVDLAHVEVTDDNFAVLERVGHWQAGADMFSDHPWLGVGIGNYALAYPAYARPHFYEALGHAHNVYINFLAETGMLGAAAFAAFWLAALALAWRTARRGTGNTAALAAGVLGTLVYLTIHNLFDNLFVAHMQLQLALLLAAISARVPAVGVVHEPTPGASR